MDIQFHGANCISIVTKQAKLIIDDTLESFGGLSLSKPGDILLFTTVHPETPPGVKLMVDQPGEYEVSGISIYGIAARAHLEEKGKTATMYKILVNEVSILVVGHIYPELNDSQLEAIGMIDIMFIPVGGNGYTLDPIGALKIIKKVEPKLVIPTNYESKKLNFPVPQQPLDQVLQTLPMEPKEVVAKYKPKSENFTEGAINLIVLEEV